MAPSLLASMSLAPPPFTSSPLPFPWPLPGPPPPVTLPPPGRRAPPPTPRRAPPGAGDVMAEMDDIEGVLGLGEEAQPVGLDDTALQSLIKTSYEDAAGYCDDVLAPERERAFEYYLGEIYTRDGEPEKAEDLQGRTSIVSREVADVIHQMLPGIIRIFTSGEEVVRYEPQNEEDVPVAEQQTDYVNFLLDADGNNWFITLHDAVHDALLKKNGTIKWWWDERAQIEEFRYSGLSPVQAETLRSDPEIDVLEETATAAEAGDGPPPVSPAAPVPPAPGAMPPPAAAPGGPAGMAPPVPPGPPGATPPGAPPQAPPQALPVPPEVSIDMRVRRTRIRKCLRICAVAPEEFIAAAEAARPCFLDLVEQGEVSEYELPTEISHLECFEGRNWYNVFDDPDYDERYFACLDAGFSG